MNDTKKAVEKMFNCQNSCGACCGIIPISKELAKKTEHLAQVKPERVIETEKGLHVITKDLLCVYLNRKNKKCMIYEERPQVCRDYGIIPALPCPYFRADGVRRDKIESTVIQLKINKQIDTILERIEKNKNRGYLQ
jgi:Fe-S-cluster containining protein